MVSSVSGSTAALQGQIQRATLDLNDWVSCVSAKTPKGQEEIQKYSGEISAAKEEKSRLLASSPQSLTGASATPAVAGSASARSTTPSHPTGQSGHLIDVWA